MLVGKVSQLLAKKCVWRWRFLKWGYPNSWMVFVRENPHRSKWMLTRGTPILGNPHTACSTHTIWRNASLNRDLSLTLSLSHHIDDAWRRHVFHTFLDDNGYKPIMLVHREYSKKGTGDVSDSKTALHWPTASPHWQSRHVLAEPRRPWPGSKPCLKADWEWRNYGRVVEELNMSHVTLFQECGFCDLYVYLCLYVWFWRRSDTVWIDI